MQKLFCTLSLLCLVGTSCGWPGWPTDLENDLATLAAMRAEIKSLTANRICSTAGDCVIASYGIEPCGGPTAYVIYSRATVDEAVLTAKLQEYSAFEAYVNDQYHLDSDCVTVHVPPAATDQGGFCVAGDAAVPIGDTPLPTGDWNIDSVTLAAMRAEIKALAADRTCSSDSDCAIAAYGHKACGGPTGYLIYSRATVNEAVLMAKLQEYSAFEALVVDVDNLSSDCSIVSGPAAAIDQDGVCVAADAP